ncbi:TonB-dependent receptor [Pedobacter antarcticus 4BY]|uniref:TonB-dependent receptor n=3 Tax=Pedobacter antarcticus TaxID=34086 RepID=A0A081PL94_9SPHI|nr:TonB-dependent receptor [Pedobacter antarcticus 4BY]SFE74784.1 TonB-linked outer membrane protein, SusC/RagA family [Pedobacter antarcticus]
MKAHGGNSDLFCNQKPNINTIIMKIILLNNCWRHSRYALLLLLIFLSAGLKAQTPVIKGKVVDEQNAGLPGATISIKGKKTATASDGEGNFVLSAEPNDILLINLLGYTAAEVKVGMSKQITISLNSSSKDLSEVVVVGYGTQLKKDLTGSVALVDAAEIKKTSGSDIGQLLQGRTPGISVTTDGQPGASPTIRIRGLASFNNQQPLYVVDGIMLANTPRDFSPNDIESMQVLKDGTAAAIYGAAAANGVIIITTKQGKRNTPLQIGYNGYVGIDKVWQRIPVANREQYQMLNNESQLNGGEEMAPANDPASSMYINTINTDWQKEGLKTGHRMNHNLNFSGGAENSTYNVSMDYYKQGGTIVGQGPDYDRYTGRINTTQQKGIFKFGQSLSYTHSKENSLTFRGDVLTGGRPPLINDLLMAIPTQLVYDPNMPNGYGGTQSDREKAISLNVVAVNNMFTNYTEVDRIFGVAWAEAQLLNLNGHSLKYKVNLGYDRTVARDFSYQPVFDLGFFFKQTVSRLDDNSRVFTNGLIDNTLTYDKVFGKHSLNVVTGVSYNKNTSLYRSGHAEDVDPEYLVLGNGNNKTVDGSMVPYAFFGMFGRLNYNFDDKYLLTANFRRDGSSRFGYGYKYGNFPGVSAGWRISKESFIHLPKWVNELKLRGGWGQLGNANIGDFRYLALLNPNIVYNFNGTKVTGGTQTNVVDPNIRWETKTTSNIGVDATFFDGMFDLTAEYYNNKASNALIGEPIPASVGSIDTAPITNAASIRNTGVEINLAYHKKGGDFTYSIAGNVSTVKNTLLKLSEGETSRIVGGFISTVGKEIGRHYGRLVEGIFQNDEEIKNHAFQNAGTAPGDLKFKDISGPDGVPDGVINDLDRTDLGSSLPKVYYGLNFTAAYKGFDFTLFMSGAGGNLINGALYRTLMHTTDYINYHTDALNRWNPSNTNTEFPRLAAKDPNQNGVDSDRKNWLQKGDYLRINTVSLGYTFQNMQVNWMKDLRIYATAQNLHTFQSYKGYNPDFAQTRPFEPGFDPGSYPTPRTFLLGVQVKF